MRSNGVLNIDICRLHLSATGQRANAARRAGKGDNSPYILTICAQIKLSSNYSFNKHVCNEKRKQQRNSYVCCNIFRRKTTSLYLCQNQFGVSQFSEHETDNGLKIYSKTSKVVHFKRNLILIHFF